MSTINGSKKSTILSLNSSIGRKLLSARSKLIQMTTTSIQITYYFVTKVYLLGLAVKWYFSQLVEKLLISGNH